VKPALGTLEEHGQQRPRLAGIVRFSRHLANIPYM
jgi:hypothetical protein